MMGIKMEEQQLPSPTDTKKFLDYLMGLKSCQPFEGADDGENWRYPVYLSAIYPSENGYKYYRIKDDRHWILRQKWIESDFTLPIECLNIKGGWSSTNPNWIPGMEYREKPMQESSIQSEEIYEKHKKFASYWEEQGKPLLEYKGSSQNDSAFVKLEGPPAWWEHFDYRIAGDRHWALRKKWVDSDFKLKFEVRQYEEFEWIDAAPDWDPRFEYREKPDLNAFTVYAKAIDRRTEIIDEFEKAQLTPVEVNLQTLEADVGPFERGVDGTDTDDPGSHYRFVYRVCVTDEDAKKGYVDVKLDPFRIAAVYKMTDFPLQTILKKTLCAGNRGHNDLREDLKDIICAAKRKLEMLDEDEQVTETKKEEL